MQSKAAARQEGPSLAEPSCEPFPVQTRLPCGTVSESESMEELVHLAAVLEDRQNGVDGNGE